MGEYVNMALEFRSQKAANRAYIQNICLHFKGGFYYDADWLSGGFWFCRNGSPNEGITRVKFTNEETGQTLLEMNRSTMPEHLYGYSGNAECNVFGLGYTVRYSFNTGRAIYRNYPCALSPKYTKTSNSNSLVSPSDYARYVFDVYWYPRQSDMFGWCLNPNADLNIVQKAHKERYCTEVVVYGVNIEKRFQWV
jgi:hypothetical protein